MHQGNGLQHFTKVVGECFKVHVAQGYHDGVAGAAQEDICGAGFVTVRTKSLLYLSPDVFGCEIIQLGEHFAGLIARGFFFGGLGLQFESARKIIGKVVFAADGINPAEPASDIVVFIGCINKMRDAKRTSATSIIAPHQILGLDAEFLTDLIHCLLQIFIAVKLSALGIECEITENDLGAFGIGPSVARFTIGQAHAFYQYVIQQVQQVSHAVISKVFWSNQRAGPCSIL